MSSNHDAARGSGQVQPTKRTALCCCRSWRSCSRLRIPVSTSGGASRNPPASATTTPGTTVSIPGISAPPFGDNNPAKKRQRRDRMRDGLSGQWVSDHDGDCPEPHPLRRFWISGRASAAAS